VKQIEVTILGQSYRLGCPDGGETTLLAAVATVDKEMSAIRDAGKVKARERMAVLAALNLAYQLAERPASPPPPSAPSSAAEPSAPSGTTVDDDEVQALITRIDAALGDDGRLL
jgi:cell division protein ZapA